jgi:hypothetical protein
MIARPMQGEPLCVRAPRCVTHGGETEDHVLERGQRQVPAVGSRMLMHAMAQLRPLVLARSSSACQSLSISRSRRAVASCESCNSSAISRTSSGKAALSQPWALWRATRRASRTLRTCEVGARA